MTIYRHPVPADQRLPPRLPCIDVVAGKFVPGECKRLRDACVSKTFDCPNLDASKLHRDKCWKSAFLCPRGARGWSFHFQQGVDLVSGAHGATIVSVTSGVVDEAASTYEAGVGGYGRTVVIRSEVEGANFFGHHRVPEPGAHSIFTGSRSQYASVGSRCARSVRSGEGSGR